MVGVSFSLTYEAVLQRTHCIYNTVLCLFSYKTEGERRGGEGRGRGGGGGPKKSMYVNLTCLILISDVFFSFPNSPKDLDLSYKTDLHFFLRLP